MLQLKEVAHQSSDHCSETDDDTLDLAASILETAEKYALVLGCIGRKYMTMKMIFAFLCTSSKCLGQSNGNYK